jgi:hypothetical protein
MGREMKKIAVLILAVVLLSGCATVQPIHTQSGRPEVTICGVSKNEVMEKFVASLSTGTFTVRSTSNFQVVVGRPVNNPLAIALYGSRYDSTPEARVIFTFSEVSGCTLVSARLLIVTNPGSAFERVMDISQGKDAHELQLELEKLKSTIEGIRGKPISKEQIKQKEEERDQKMEEWKKQTLDKIEEYNKETR